MILSHFSFPSDFKCMEALGMESGEIHSDQITASSQYSTNWSAERSRLNYPENGWTPGEDSYKEWIQVCSIRCSTFLVEEFSHLERLLNKGSAMPNAFKWEEKAHVQSQHRTIASLRGQGKADPDDVLKICVPSHMWIFTELEHRYLTLVTTKWFHFFQQLHVFYQYAPYFNRFLFPWWNILTLHLNWHEIIVS